MNFSQNFRQSVGQLKTYESVYRFFALLSMFSTNFFFFIDYFCAKSTNKMRFFLISGTLRRLKKAARFACKAIIVVLI